MTRTRTIPQMRHDGIFNTLKLCLDILTNRDGSSDQKERAIEELSSILARVRGARISPIQQLGREISKDDLLSIEPIFHDRYIVSNEGCWDWIGPVNLRGYGVLNARRRRFAAHRFSYELFHGGLKREALVCHHCDNPRCVNPAHLYQGTASDNANDASKRGRLGFNRGEAHYAAKITQNDVQVIRASGASHASLARTYGISESTVRSIRKRTRWSHVA